MTEPWRWMNHYLCGEYPDLTRLLRTQSGVYLIARPTSRDRVLANDIIYIGLAGANVDANGTFEQRIRSHAGKLQRGIAEPGCPQAWAGYQQDRGGPNALQNHALRLVVMPSRTLEEKSSIKRLEDFLLLLWQITCEGATPQMPRLNTKGPDIAGVTAIFEGAVEDHVTGKTIAADFERAADAQQGVAGLVGEAVADPVEILWPNEDDSIENAERLADYQQFFAVRNLLGVWDSITAAAARRRLALRVIAMRDLMRHDRPGELRLATVQAGGQRSQQTHAIMIPDLDGHVTAVELRLPPEQLPDHLAALAGPCRRGKMRSRLRLPTERLLEVVELFA